MEPEYWWRCTTDFRAATDEWDNVYICGPYMYLKKYEVVRHTPKGVWIRVPFGGEKFILGKALRQFAVPTKEIAMRDEIERRKREVRGHEHRRERALKRQQLVERELKHAHVGFH